MSIFGSQNTFLNIAKKDSTSRVGKDVVAFCSRCKLNLSHTIMTASAQNKPERVRCNTCKTERTYRAPKNDAALKASGGQGMSDRDEEFDLDTMSADVTKVLLGADGKKKPKAKAKAKAKKEKGDTEPRLSAKAASALPLSMQRGTPEDMATFEAKLLQNKNAVSQAKEYKATQRFNTGEVINHKVFGTGFVVAESGLNKIEVLFREGRKLLVTIPKG
ncbi:MAG: hypothetical protein IOD12_14560 [Silvanigrellales bacterium]|jgi:hypothetical protein|nr:hypothetical protein [Silvanigrellales bacterium]